MKKSISLATAEELEQLPDSGARYELVQGELRTTTPAGREHGAIAMRLGASLHFYVRDHGLGEVYAAETGFKIRTNPDTVRAPDAAFVSRQRLKSVAFERGYWPGAPDLVAEVVSPNDTYADMNEKVHDWLEAGAQMVLVVDPRKRLVTVYRSRSDVRVLAEPDQLDEAAVVPGWTLLVADLFH